jgi:hypothetical protein
VQDSVIGGGGGGAQTGAGGGGGGQHIGAGGGGGGRQTGAGGGGAQQGLKLGAEYVGAEKAGAWVWKFMGEGAEYWGVY